MGKKWGGEEITGESTIDHWLSVLEGDFEKMSGYGIELYYSFENEENCKIENNDKLEWCEVALNKIEKESKKFLSYMTEKDIG